MFVKKTRAQRPRPNRARRTILHLSNTRLNNDEKKELREPASSQLVISLSRSIFSASSLSDKVFMINCGYRTGVATNGAGVMTFSLPTGQVLAASLSPTIVPEFTALATLFDEYKVSGVSYVYDPVNPFNRGAVTQSIPIAMFWDDVDSTLAPANSNAGMGSAAQRGKLYHSFSPDIPQRGTFTRASSMNLYDWTPVTLPGTEVSSFGGLYVIGDGTNTASITYGYLTYWFHASFRMRQ